MSASTSTSTSALPTLRQALCQLSSPSSLPTSQLSVHWDLNLGPAQLSVHRWTSTWDLPSSACTAGPQPGTLPAQCAPLDLNQGPSQLSVHRWTSTWDLPSPVCTAGPQRPNRMTEDMPDICQIECQKICQIKCQKICQTECQKVCQIECQIECQ